MMQVYISPAVAAIQAFYGDLLSSRIHYSIGEHLTLLAERLWQGLQTQHVAAFTEISNNHPSYLGASYEALATVGWTEFDARHTIAKVYGIEDWDDWLLIQYDPPFEEALDAFLGGEEALFRQLLQQYPKLPTQRSPYGHRATLLHYASANGVELWRQQVPTNLANMVSILLAAGADPSAGMQVYGGAYQTQAIGGDQRTSFCCGGGRICLGFVAIAKPNVSNSCGGEKS